MQPVTGFPPVVRDDARILVLGSMPGRQSLAANQYYAHPRNAFWPIMQAIFDIQAAAPYTDRCAGLVQHHIALWDVLKACHRPSSLDADIDDATIQANDFGRFLRLHPAISAVFFNGSKAAEVWRRRIAPTLPEASGRLPTFRLPSTSPAHAGRSFHSKLTAWREVEGWLQRPAAPVNQRRTRVTKSKA
ncbi:MAG: DNA-deoxyinosine glycosylase [Gammaproteobacteria bacterium]|nr:DNA-deoxyinosine glycosylase [Gammaproteobacteria bacterium]